MALFPSELEHTDKQLQDPSQDAGTEGMGGAKHQEIPLVTPQKKTNMKSNHKGMGQAPVLTRGEETELVHWIASASKAGFLIKKSNLLDSVKMLVKRLERRNQFTNGRPGKSWFSSFLRRNPVVVTQFSENYTASGAEVTAESLGSWYSKVNKYLTENDHLSIMANPKRVYSCDESAFHLNPKGKRVLSIRGQKNIYKTMNPEDRDCLTALITGNAAGQLTPPLIVFRQKRISKNIALSIPSEWGIAQSDSGWVTGATFLDFLKETFYPWLVKENIELPVVLFADSHTSHLNFETSRFCEENGIILVGLHPNSTQTIKPVEISLIRVLKIEWKKTVRNWKSENCEYPILTKENFAPLLKQTLDAVPQRVIMDAFFGCGLYPWNPNDVEFSSKKEAEELNWSVVLPLPDQLDNEKLQSGARSDLKLHEEYLRKDQKKQSCDRAKKKRAEERLLMKKEKQDLKRKKMEEKEWKQKNQWKNGSSWRRKGPKRQKMKILVTYTQDEKKQSSHSSKGEVSGRVTACATKAYSTTS